QQAAYVEERVVSRVTVDRDAPSSTVRSYDHQVGAVNYLGAFQRLAIQASDATSSVARVEIGVGRDANDLTWRTAEPCEDGVAWCPAFDAREVGGEGRVTIQTRATDVAGNVEQPVTRYTFLVDTTAPALDITVAEGALVPRDPVSTGRGATVTLRGTVRDPDLAGGHPGSGVASVGLEILDAEGRPTRAGGQLALIQGEAWHVTYPVADLMGGSYTLRLRTEDRRGNRQSLTRIVQINRDGPALALHTPGTSEADGQLGVGAPLSGVVTPTLGGGLASVETALIARASFLSNEVPPDNEVLHLTMDEQGRNDSLQLFDLAGGGSITCQSEAIFARCPSSGWPGRIGQALAFAKTTALIVPNSPELNPDDSFTMALWVVPGQLDHTTPEASFLRKGNPAGQGYALALRPDGYRAYLGSAILDLPFPAASAELSRWHHLSVTWQRNGELRGYLNGELVATTAAGSASLASSDDLWIGNDGVSEPLLLDEVRLFRRALEASEVRQLASSATPVVELGFEAQALVGDGVELSNSAAGMPHATLLTGPDDARNKVAQGQVGASSLNLDGLDDRVRVPDVRLKQHAFTVAFWAQRSEVDRYEVVVSQGDVSTGARLALGFNANNQFFCGFQDDELRTPETVSDPNWHHWACTYDYTTGERVIYRDGQLVAADRTAPDAYHGTGALWLGAGEQGSNHHFKGQLDDLKIYQRSLTADQVRSLTAAGWQPTTLSAQGSGVTEASWQTTPPLGLEGTYALHLRSTDSVGNQQILSAAWIGQLDTLAPRAVLTRQIAPTQTTYELIASDLNLDADALSFAPCQLQEGTSERYVLPWLLAAAGRGYVLPFRTTFRCTVEGTQSGAVSATVRDRLGNETTASLGEGAAMPVMHAEQASLLAPISPAALVIAQPAAVEVGAANVMTPLATAEITTPPPL
ncbi:MAG: LamG domain-containing protein, partial [Chloroflexia bacterium]|nr:LamG domain-containing protein [Chloroflexia bacterium]